MVCLKFILLDISSFFINSILPCIILILKNFIINCILKIVVYKIPIEKRVEYLKKAKDEEERYEF